MSTTTACRFTGTICETCPSPTCYYDLDQYDDDPYYDDHYDGDEWGDRDAECEAYGGIGCKHLSCAHWGGDGLCFVEMGAGY